jgi:hypothetical protein
MGPSTDVQTSPRRRWVAIGVATGIGAISYFLLIRAAVGSLLDAGQEVVAPAFFFGMTAVPLAFVALAFISRHKSAPVAVLAAMGLFLCVGLPIGFMDPALGLVAGFGAGAVVALRRDDDHSWRVRIVAVVIGLVYTLVTMIIMLPIGVFTGAFVPFLAVGFGDQYAEGRAAEVRSRRKAPLGEQPQATGSGRSA